MKKYLLKQAMILPLAAMLVPITIALFLPNYSSISQHISEVALLDHPIAIIQRSAAILTGVSIALFGVWLYLARLFKFTALVAVIFAISMVSNGIFVMGSPMHGLYGLGFFMVLIPAFFAAEVGRENIFLKNFSMLIAFLTMSYLWLMVSGLDLHAIRGLTQRVATLIIFGWYSVVCFSLLKNNINNERTVQGT